MGNSDDENPTNTITIKPPTFCESSAQGWFAVLEAQFKLKGISKTQTQFYNALSALPPQLVTNIPHDIISKEHYDELKTHVINSYEQTKPEIFEKLAQTTTMTGRPSLYLQELQSLARRAGISECQDLIRHKFLSSLPHTISPAVAAQTSLSLTQLGSLADELMPMHNKFCNLTLNNKNTDRNTSHTKQNNKNTVDSPNTIPTGLRPFSTDQKPKICRTHIYFAEKAHHCKPWCKFPSKTNCKMEPSSRPSTPTPSENSMGGSN